jgi:saccharopine dehydrogenase (NADP+, L-glutamate forming)
MKSVLILGAGLVSRPAVSYLLARTGHRVVVATRRLERAERLIQDDPRGEARRLDMRDAAALEGAIREADVVISLVPYAYHVAVAKLAIRHGTHVVTTSYVSPAMRALDEDARRAGVVVFNELGLDPGIDHMSTMQVVHRVHRTGGRIVRFTSCCGGLPAPEANTNPWGYKFSWSPRGVVLASGQPARYLREGQAVEIPGPNLFDHRWPYEVEDLGLYEIYPNRDSIAYTDTYGLSGIRSMFRGTIRNVGWCETFKALADLGVLDQTERDWESGATYAAFLSTFLPPGRGALVERLAGHLGIPRDHDIVTRLEWAGLLSERPLPGTRISPLDVLVHRLLELMAYRPGERDMIVLRHEFVAEWNHERHAERIVSLLTDFGDPGGATAMARTVSLPAAIATRLLLEGGVGGTAGVQIPVLPELYVPVLNELGEMGIRFKEWTTRILPGPFDAPGLPLPEARPTAP